VFMDILLSSSSDFSPSSEDLAAKGVTNGMGWPRASAEKADGGWHTLSLVGSSHVGRVGLETVRYLTTLLHRSLVVVQYLLVLLHMSMYYNCSYIVKPEYLELLLNKFMISISVVSYTNPLTSEVEMFLPGCRFFFQSFQ